MGSSKSGGDPPSATVDNTANEDAQAEMMAALQAMSQMSQMMMASAMNSGSSFEATAMPVITKADEVDWTEENEKLANKMKGEYTVSQAQKKGRQDTILTSPLLDEEEAATTASSIISGKTS